MPETLQSNDALSQWSRTMLDTRTIRVRQYLCGIIDFFLNVGFNIRGLGTYFRTQTDLDNAHSEPRGVSKNV